MLLNSEIGGGVIGRSTYFTYKHHVDDQNTHRHDRVEREIYDRQYNIITLYKIRSVSQEASDTYCDYCQTHNGFLRSGISAQLTRLYKRITYYNYSVQVCRSFVLSRRNVGGPCYMLHPGESR